LSAGPCRPRESPGCATAAHASPDRQSRTPLQYRGCRCAPSSPWFVANVRQKQFAVIRRRTPRQLIVDLRRLRLTNASSRQLVETCPSLSYRDRVCVRALCGSPFPILLQPPTQNSPGRHWRLRHPEPGCKSRSRPERHRGLRTQPCSNRSREIRLTAARLVRLSAKFPTAPAILFDNASDTDAAAHKA